MGKGLGDNFFGPAQDFQRVVLDPAWLLIDLTVFFLSDATTRASWSNTMKRALVVP
jgi:hypothetical protein